MSDYFYMIAEIKMLLNPDQKYSSTSRVFEEMYCIWRILNVYCRVFVWFSDGSAKHFTEASHTFMLAVFFFRRIFFLIQIKLISNLNGTLIKCYVNCVYHALVLELKRSRVGCRHLGLGRYYKDNFTSLNSYIRGWIYEYH